MRSIYLCGHCAELRGLEFNGNRGVLVGGLLANLVYVAGNQARACKDCGSKLRDLYKLTQNKRLTQSNESV